MKRYLVFDASCSVCTNMAQKLCNESEEWIHGILGTQDSNVKEWLKVANVSTLAGPAIIEVDGQKINVVHGRRFRWRVFKVLGSARSFKLAKIFAGDLASALHDEPNQITLQAKPIAADKPTDAPLSVVQIPRRSFMRMVTGVAAGVAVITGFGLSRLATAANQQRALRGLRARRYMSYPPAMRNMKLTGTVRKHISMEERERVWQMFVNSKNVQTLLSSRDFDIFHKANDIRSVLFSNSVPAILAETEAEAAAFAAGRSKEEVAQYPRMVSSERDTEDGRVLTLTAVLIGGNIIMSNLQLAEGEEIKASVLEFVTIDPNGSEESSDKTLARIINGRFAFKREGDFSARSMAKASEVAIPESLSSLCPRCGTDRCCGNCIPSGETNWTCARKFCSPCSYCRFVPGGPGAVALCFMGCIVLLCEFLLLTSCARYQCDYSGPPGS